MVHPKTALMLASLLAVSACAPQASPANCEPPADVANDATPETSPDATDDALAAPDSDPGPSDPPPDPDAAMAVLEAHCDDLIGEPRVLEVAPGLWVAIGYDLANTILVETSEGNVVIDVGMSPARASEARAALDAAVGGELAAVIYTHSHIDHVGGATVWAAAETPIWATEAFAAHFVKQYGAFAPAETRRGNRQFGLRVEDTALPCSALGRRADVDAALETGALMPTHTFSGFEALEIGGVRIELHEAHGETHDQLYVWLPDHGALLPGDNYYAAFPNLYTIRGTSPRPVDDWIESLDRMRAHDAVLLVPSHTAPVVGRDAVRDALRGYRDAIQWVRDAVVRGANAGSGVDALVASIALPEHLAARRDLLELYGRVDWSVRAIYSGNLGWFDERSETLVPPADSTLREIAMMGGRSAVLGAAQRALDADDPRWAAHLAGRLRTAGLGGDDVDALFAAALRAAAAGEANTNARGWLFERARELVDPAMGPPATITMNERLVDQLPVELVFDVLPSRLDVEAAGSKETALRLLFPDRSVTISVRRGLAEVHFGETLPGSPPVTATVTTDELTWKQIALGIREPAEALVAGDLTVDDIGAAIDFLALFDAGL